MKQSESIKNIAAALLAAQTKMGGASKGASNPFFKSKYADYGSVLEACKEPLNEAGVVILQPHFTDATGTFVVTQLIHAASGEWISSQTQVIAAKQNDPQAFGGALTYSRRYGLQSLLSLPTEDDDGESAMARPKSPVTKAAPPVAKPVAAPQATVTANIVAPPAVKSTFKKPATKVTEEPANTQTPVPSETDEWEN